ncbi:MAG: CidA/LrgA family protein [Moraxella sp.]|nr:MAG: CidA/LrgA family protein [Moraxella sp.]
MILKAFLVVFGCLFLGEVFIRLTHLPLPASIIGLLLLFFALQTGVVELKTVQSLAKIMLDYLVLMVVPACISIMQYLDIIQKELWILLLATSLSTFLVLIATGRTYQIVRYLQKSFRLKSNR